MRKLFRGRVQKHITILGWPASAPGLKEVLQRYANFAFDAANGLLKGAGKDRISFSTLTGNCSFVSV
jgi:hypothetical protein